MPGHRFAERFGKSVKPVPSLQLNGYFRRSTLSPAAEQDNGTDAYVLSPILPVPERKATPIAKFLSLVDC